MRASVGIDDETGSAGSVTFEVLVDGILRWASPRLTGSDGPVAVDVPLTGARQL
jgi:hypothetical protein